MTTPLSQIPHFDPMHAPVLGIDTDLPAVDAARLSEQALRQRFAAPPAWQPESMVEKKFSNRVPSQAAVLVPLVMREQPTVLLTLRTAHLATHSGQIAFPGGKTDKEDASPIATALREAQEEVGLQARWVHVLGPLPIYVTGTAFVVTPVVALVDPSHQLQPNPDEVAQAFEVPLAFLMNPANHRRHAIEWGGERREWFSMPWQDGAQQRFIWGATAGMLRNLYRFLVA